VINKAEQVSPSYETCSALKHAGEKLSKTAKLAA
jgi:hypothetical protein